MFRAKALRLELLKGLRLELRRDFALNVDILLIEYIFRLLVHFIGTTVPIHWQSISSISSRLFSLEV
jgi:hypothetical protein